MHNNQGVIEGLPEQKDPVSLYDSQPSYYLHLSPHWCCTKGVGHSGTSLSQPIGGALRHIL